MIKRGISIAILLVFNIVPVCAQKKENERVANAGRVMSEILQSSGGGAFIPKLEEVLRRRAEQTQVSSNFRKGDDDAWRTGIPAEFHEMMWDAIDSLAKELLALKP